MTTIVDAIVANLGWAATAVFTASYFCRRPEALRLVQMLGAALWFAYGVATDAPPVIVANILVFTVAGVTTVREHRRVRAAARLEG